MDQSRLTYSILLITGATVLFLSAIFVSSFLAFIGLGLVFWGIIFPYIRTEQYTKKSLFDATLHSQSALIGQALQHLQFEGDAVYLPPKYFADPDTIMVYVPRQKEIDFSVLEVMQKQEFDSPNQVSGGLLLMPVGYELAELFEKILGTNFTRVDLNYLQAKIHRLLVEELEIARKVEMQIKGSNINVRFENLKVQSLSEEIAHQAPLGSVLSSSIACAIAKASGKPVRIEKQQVGEFGYVVMHYQILDVGV
jgi:hypothetical protein